MVIKSVGVIFAVLATIGVAVTLVGSTLIASVVIPYEGKVTTPSPPPPPSTVEIGTYWDSGCTSKFSSVNVGDVQAGSVTSTTVYVRNEGNTAVTLSMRTENLNPPEASNDITLSWDYDGQSVSPDQVIQVILTLSVSSQISGITNFNFDCVITGE